MNYCSNCKSDLNYIIPKGDNRSRYVCDSCDTIHYQNPKVVVGCIPVFENKILLCRRNIEPKKGYWNLPAGFMENGETVEEGALREVWEEAGAKVEIDRLFAIFNIIHVNQVYLIFLAKMNKLEYFVGDESSEVKLFLPDEIPFDELAFESNKFALFKYLNDSDLYKVHFGSYKRIIL